MSCEVKGNRHKQRTCTFRGDFPILVLVAADCFFEELQGVLRHMRVEQRRGAPGAWVQLSLRALRRQLSLRAIRGLRLHLRLRLRVLRGRDGQLPRPFGVVKGGDAVQQLHLLAGYNSIPRLTNKKRTFRLDIGGKQTNNEASQASKEGSKEASEQVSK